MKGASHLDSVAAGLRAHGRFELLSPFNEKTPKGESEGYLTAIMYLAPHTIAGGKSLCPHSTAACRAACLFHAGRGRTPRVENARIRRSRFYLEDREPFLLQLIGELDDMQKVADEHGLTLAIRLNGTSDILWEREAEANLFEIFPRATFYDYTRTPLLHRRVPANWKLVFSLADDPVERAIEMLAAGHSVAAVVPDDEKARAVELDVHLGERCVNIIDGDAHDLRFLDPPGSLVLLKPKGRLRAAGPQPMVRAGLVGRLVKVARELA